MKKVLIVALMLCAMTKAWSSQSPCADVSTEALSQIRGNVICASGPYATTGGCTTCQSAGNMTMTLTYVVSGVTYTTTSIIPAFKKCNFYAVDEKCLQGPTILSWCIKTTTACGGVGSIYSDANCTTALTNQPPGGFTCGLSYVKTANLLDANLDCGTITAPATPI